MANKYQIDKLLKKKGWTGKEVGQLLIASLLNDIKQIQQKEKTPLLSQSDFEKLESSLNSDYDFTTYGVYRDLYTSITNSFNRGLGLHQQFYNGFSKLFSVFYEVYNADQAQASIDDTPLIMTESQYNRLEAEAIQTLRDEKDSYYSLFFSILERCILARDNAPEPIRDAIEATKKIPAENISFSNSYNKYMGEGYYSLPDGRRSDQMTSEEWETALDEIFISKHKITTNRNPAATNEAIQDYNQARLIKNCELFFKGAKAIREFVQERTGRELGLTDEEIEEALNGAINGVEQKNDIAEALSSLSLAEWHTYEELPDGLTAYDLLGLITDTSQHEETDHKKHLKAFQAEYKELYTALNAYIEENVPTARGLNANQLYKKIVSWGELADAGIIGYNYVIQPTDNEIIDIWAEGEDIAGNKSRHHRTNFNGIAILKNPKDRQTDKNGDFVEKENPLQFFKNLYTLEKNEDKIKAIQGYTNNLMYPALNYLYAFNSLMEIIGEVYDLPELAEVAKLDTGSFENNMESFNGILYMFYHNVYGDKEEQKKKRAIIKDIFIPLETDNLKPSQKAIEEVTAELKKLGFSSEARKNLKYLNRFIDRLMYSREGAL